MYCWLKLTVHPKWLLAIANSIKTAKIIIIKNQDGDQTEEELTKKVKRGFRGRKCGEEKEKREGMMAKTIERFKYIITKKEKTCVKRNDRKEEKRSERFEKFTAKTKKRIKLKEKRIEPTSNSDNAKMLNLKIKHLDTNAVKIVQTYNAKMFKRLAIELEESTAKK
ncbi:hypothetical protein D1007_37114 [Hordeum vulgare]|nr:hypothetical protein D1007_37114 [Hordeum vulgare]